MVLTPGWCTLSMLFSDWDRSGRRDLRVSNDRHYSVTAQEQLWRIEPGEAPRLWTHEEGWQPVRIWGMGIASYDLTGDGYPEVFLTSQADNRLQTLADGPAQPIYEDIAHRARARLRSKPYTGDVDLPSTAWHAEFEDVNNDGLIDLFVAKGNVEAQPDYAARDPNNLLIGQPDGTFVEGADGRRHRQLRARPRRGARRPQPRRPARPRRRQPARERQPLAQRRGRQRRRPGADGQLAGAPAADGGANRDAIGAWVEVTVGDRVISREVTVGGGHAGGQLGWIHFGLGEADRAEVRVTWPDGEDGPRSRSRRTRSRSWSATPPIQPRGSRRTK